VTHCIYKEAEAMLTASCTSVRSNKEQEETIFEDIREMWQSECDLIKEEVKMPQEKRS
jgi:hypothetical protein